ncbi:hypothetical protein SDC9_207269 [bioreactor metagenome]|uniref:Uncharacterized protein n=1 Tax=bioreactor metagenome TaxID=1076179 RepID=A0A645J7B4_9ZZZZ
MDKRFLDTGCFRIQCPGDHFGLGMTSGKHDFQKQGFLRREIAVQRRPGVTGLGANIRHRRAFETGHPEYLGSGIKDALALCLALGSHDDSLTRLVRSV